MTIKMFFTIISVLALIHGAGFVLLPEQVAASYGMATSAPTVLMARLFGAALVGLGLIFWLTRDASLSSARIVFLVTIVGNTAGLIVVVLGTVARTLNAMGWIAAFLSLRSGWVWLLRDLTIGLIRGHSPVGQPPGQS